MNASMFTAGCLPGECIYAKTETAEYWMLILSSQVASVFRKGFSRFCAERLGTRKLGAQIVEHEGFMMYDESGEPLTAIVPTEIKKVPSDSIPLRREVV